MSELIEQLKREDWLSGFTCIRKNDDIFLFWDGSHRAMFKIILTRTGVSFQFGVLSSGSPELKNEFINRLHAAGAEINGEIKSTADMGARAATITLNGKSFETGTNEGNNYLVIKSTPKKAANDKAKETFKTFVQDVTDSGIDKIFYDVFGSGKSNPGKSLKNDDLPPAGSRQIIYFGAPGTGKSKTLKEDAEKFTADANQERVTFYPGYSYQQFVGTYKPFMADGSISYQFVPGPLLRLLEDALKAEKRTAGQQDASNNKDNETSAEKYLLIVEELNRTEAAAVFGDLFQLLDRGNNGKSEYDISVSEDLNQYLRRKDGVWHGETGRKKLYFPSNFYIWATMNSADQGVFPLDTAFKRRWDFKYFGINNGEKNLTSGVQKLWNTIRRAINNALLHNLNLNEDKLLGPFFMKAAGLDEQDFWEHFCSKVLLYLFEDAARLNRSRIFREKVTYSEMYENFKKIKSSGENWHSKLENAWKAAFCFDLDYSSISRPWTENNDENKNQDDLTDDEDADNEQNQNE